MNLKSGRLDEMRKVFESILSVAEITVDSVLSLSLSLTGEKKRR